MLSFDNRRNIFIAKTHEQAIDYAADDWFRNAKRSIQSKGRFCVSLSGGSTPKAIYEKVVLEKNLVWSKVYLFWSDERAVLPDHPDSNYKMAMEYFHKVPIPPHQIFRIKAENNIETAAINYEQTIQHVLDKHLFDLVMLGCGEDGHTASLFPDTLALKEEKRLCVANLVPQKMTSRVTLTFNCINQSQRIVIYALGASKKDIIPKVLNAPIVSQYPASFIGTVENPALWILDEEAAKNLG